MSEFYNFEFHKIELMFYGVGEEFVINTDALYAVDENKAYGNLVAPKDLPAIVALRATIIPVKSGIIEPRKSVKIYDTIRLRQGDELEASYIFEDDFFDHMLQKESFEKEKFYSIIRRKTLVFDKEI